MKKIFTSIDIGSDTIRIIVAESFQKKLRVYAVSSVKSNGVINGKIVDEEQVVKKLKLAISDIEEKLGVDITKAIITIPPHDAEYELVSGKVNVINENKLVSGNDILKVMQECTKNMKYMNRELVTIVPIEFDIIKEGYLIETINDPKNKICDQLLLKAIMVTVPTKNIIPIVSVVEKAGIEIVDLNLGIIADYEEVKPNEIESNVCGIINIGKDITSIGVFNKGIITNSAIIKEGSKNIDDDISYVYYTSLKEARKVKEVFGVAHPYHSNKDETYETFDINDKLIKINQLELSEMINKRIVEILNLAKNELKLLTNKEISYIIVTGGIIDMPAIKYVVQDVLGNSASVYQINTLGIRKNRYVAASGNIKYFVSKLKLRQKEYSMFNNEEVSLLLSTKKRKRVNESVVSKFFDYFFDN